MKLIASTVAHNGKINGIIVGVSEEEYANYMRDPDIINENTVSLTFLKEYLSTRGYDSKIAEDSAFNAPAGRFGWWNFARVVSVHDLKEVLHSIDENLNFHQFIDAYCEHLKSL
ncbi:MAG: hypothetical protein JWO03_2521 [Bacteroidetes bacterium]|nr:hypothetical protein [Bacteroidota bacterium]